MASSLPSFNTTAFRATSTANPNRSDSSTRPCNTAIAAAKWWSPLFGWSTDADYITNTSPPTSDPISNNSVQIESTRSASSRSGRFAPGCFTEEKAKELRKKTAESLAFHDVMYHSAIASRLASDLNNQ